MLRSSDIARADVVHALNHLLRVLCQVGTLWWSRKHR
jgi:hypothetical protein